jgi:hypothetical protein
VKQIADIWSEIEKPIYVYYLGDHDPSGLNIEPNTHERLVGHAGDDTEIIWSRLAITEEQCLSGQYLTCEVKKGDKLAREYLEKFDRAVEVDAIDSTALRAMVEEKIVSHIDMDIWKESEEEEKEECERLLKVKWSFDE